ncbi:putative CALMODULIN-BINDING PROTEIN60 [Helianthus annuus]|uniref:CALMODULIN-BINDING PROTEIN60 n=1 Tax=Helianthus annuus TaxID=4232 RepID=A0A9K3NZ21_HELAN|nr:putative CALMODULIN-BINDING PROTEIN60 [Helianthus annuus]KAJ0938776.1 putative CALMODULIN-BINDING PROTEIN60 [Helianthus annuus]KAJ0950719.1 putative CALMODULIN-BINDING PROTEIN60 [Helianthus annuus]
MVVINHQVEDDHSTTSIIAASKEDDLKREMIRLYQGKFEDDNNDGSRVSEADMELMIRVYKDTICPMICAEINRKQQEFVFRIKKKFGFDLSTWMTWNLHNMESPSGSQSLHLKFLNGISTPITTGKDIRTVYKKHEIPSLSDHLYRLHKISHRSCYKRLSSERVKTVMDLLTLHAINPQRLKDILKVSHKTWKIIMDHANMCKDDKSKGTYLSYYPRNGQKSNGVAFNVSGQLVGIVAESKFVSSDKLPDDKRADAQKLIASSSEHWKEVVSFNDQDLLINHLQQRAILNPLSHNNLNVVIPQTFDPSNHTNLTSPKSQSPKRPASEHASSNSPKQPRYDHPKSSPSSMTSVGMDTSIRREANNLQLPLDDGDISMYLNLDLRDRRWKIVWCAVGWISVMIKLRKE